MEDKVKYHLGRDGEFVIENYNFAKPFSSFFPGIAGLYGIPLWLFYVNRGQCVASFGISDKDGQILEFYPANHAYELTQERGFRTFIKIKQAKNHIFYEPFQTAQIGGHFELSSRMVITSHDLRLEEVNKTLGLKTTIKYFTLPQEGFAALARVVTIENLAKKAMEIEVLDGLPQILPHGLSIWLSKNMSRTIEAWMQVLNLEQNVPFFNLKVEVADRPQVSHIKSGNFYLAIQEKNKKAKMLAPIIDPRIIFGITNNFALPYEFIGNKQFSLPGKQNNTNFTPSAMCFAKFTLKPKTQDTIYSLTGFISSLDKLNRNLKRITNTKYFSVKEQENEKVIKQLSHNLFTASGSHTFDLYCRQTFLDNLMRGGFPVAFCDKDKHQVFYAYSRKHGDLERDYNKFSVQPTYFSQGNGNYRDISQNRRCDVWFNPQVKDANIVTFMDLVQADGFNPLVLNGVYFIIKDKNKLSEIIKETVSVEDRQKVTGWLSAGFVPGKILYDIEEENIKLNIDSHNFITKILLESRRIDDVRHLEGFWSDHWTYNLDMIESYLDIYPENLKQLLLDKKIFTFYKNDVYVAGRKQKYVFVDGKVRQYHAVKGEASEDAKDASKDELKVSPEERAKIRIAGGSGEIYKTSLLVKLITLIVNKIASLDPAGVGIEMESNKPNWYDALNGLPGLFGSSISETFELKRLILFVKESLEKTGIAKEYKIEIFEELHNFKEEIKNLLKEDLESKSKNADFAYWDKSYTQKEKYRKATRTGINGKENSVTVSQLCDFLDLALAKIEKGISKAYDKNLKLYRTYFINHVLEYDYFKEVDADGNIKNKLNAEGLVRIKPLKFSQEALPLFLEGIVHALKVEKDAKKAQKLYEAVKKSELFDKKLKMYKVNASLAEQSEEIGRTKVFTPGWLENESIWLHMEYKYLLELLRTGLYDEFYEEIKNTLIPFMDPEIYGRSTMENSSFIASSAYPDARIHGTGFVARLSGSTAEFLNIWVWINAGKAPFKLDKNNKLELEFKPILVKEMFTTSAQKIEYYDTTGKKIMLEIPKNAYAFKFLGKTLVVYHNPKMKNTFGKNPAKITEIMLTANGKKIEIKGSSIKEPHSLNIRDGHVERIDVYLT